MENNIVDVSICLGEILHEYHERFGEEKYNTFVERLGDNLKEVYGENYSKDRLILMETYYGVNSLNNAKVKLKN